VPRVVGLEVLDELGQQDIAQLADHAGLERLDDLKGHLDRHAGEARLRLDLLLDHARAVVDDGLPLAGREQQGLQVTGGVCHGEPLTRTQGSVAHVSC
jgi:hypothetical protein